MSEPKTYGLSETELATLPLSFRNDLFKGQIALVTGAGRGIGKGIAFTLARLGAKLAITGRNVERLEGTAIALRKLGAEVLAIPMTIRDPELALKTITDVRAHFGRLDVLVNNAGGQFPQAAIDFKPKGWNAVIDTNLNGTWYMMQAAAQAWRDAGQPGAIVNIVAVVDRGLPGIAHTAAARAGVIALSKTVSVEWAPLNIRVNCIAPGVIETEGFSVYSAEARNSFPRTNPMQRTGTTRDVAEAVCYLAGPSGNFITGIVLAIDGGSTNWGDLWAIPKPAYFRNA